MKGCYIANKRRFIGILYTAERLMKGSNPKSLHQKGEEVIDVKLKFKTLSKMKGKIGTYVEAHDWCDGIHFVATKNRTIRPLVIY